ncbi:hypothetical protein BCR44DRAFT_261051 [Catenaria anguillulae PL171]|uniref:Uncharacterized protein n=1 Tax=Catenaria anguillulae PL171 TaxID=765915 RepID=A0A1Y2HPB4_9FUNG|nr:hypothetical protein BCR44DRAFT_261051 [Catenaria anguillulae PL171]
MSLSRQDSRRSLRKGTGDARKGSNRDVISGSSNVDSQARLGLGGCRPPKSQSGGSSWARENRRKLALHARRKWRPRVLEYVLERRCIRSPLEFLIESAPAPQPSCLERLERPA